MDSHARFTNDAKKLFGHEQLRQGQYEIMKAIDSNFDIIVLMPTGAGKSLCYQLPALTTEKLTVVISPLISLIHDQVSDLSRKKLPVQSIIGGCVDDINFGLSMIAPQWNNDLNKYEVNCRLLYTTPEMLIRNDSLKLLLDELNTFELLKGFVVDEAHCVSSWGHDFRSDYLELGCLKQDFPETPIWCFTATATNLVEADIAYQLKLSNYQVYRQSFIRKNLSYNIESRDDSEDIQEKILNLIKSKFHHQSGIVYCFKRDHCDVMANYLAKKGLLAESYHAGMTADDRKQVQNRWITGITHIIVGTIAFGLGINKPDVRFVIHSHMPQSIESYYQETGRAGRDGLPSQCYLFYSSKDTVFSFGKSKSLLWSMYDLCENKIDCIKQAMSNYLGEFIIYRCNNDKSEAMCSVCRKKTMSSGGGASGGIGGSSASTTDLAVSILKMLKQRRWYYRSHLIKLIVTKHPEISTSYASRFINHLICLGHISTKVQFHNETESTTDKLMPKEILMYNSSVIDAVYYGQ